MQGRNSKDVLGVIGRGVTVQGTITGIGILTIDGEVEGKISVEGTVVLDQNAVIKADITGDQVVIAGRSKGAITAKGKVHLLSSGNHTGPITSRFLITEEGSIWNGNCEMERPHAVTSEGSGP